MVRIAVHYPRREGGHFDLDYYQTTHFELVRELLGPRGLRAAVVEPGIDGPDGPAPYACIGALYFDSVEAFGQAWAIGGDQLVADIPNYTNIDPVIQIAEVREIGLSP